MPETPDSVLTDPAAAKYLAGAVDLSGLAHTPAAGEQDSDATSDQVPNEFRVAIVGDQRGRPRVMLAFGHLQWVFEPQLAADLGTVLADAATKAAQMAPVGPDLTPAPTAGLLP